MHKKHQRAKRGQICDAIRNLIIKDKLNVGDKLDAERVLAGKMNVQRLTVRRAIKKLCEEGLLEQRPNSGTYLKKKIKADVEKDAAEHHESVFSPTGNIFVSRPDTVINFYTGDVLPEQMKGWKHILNEFSKKHPGITVRHLQNTRITPNSCNYDCALIRPMDMHAKNTASTGMLFPDTWFSAHKIDSFLSEGLIERINNYNKVENGFEAVPMLLTFPVQVVNADLLEKNNLPMLPSRADWREAEKWLNTVNSVDGLVPTNPYIHSPLNHICRVNKDVVSRNCVDLSCDGIKEFLHFVKGLWRDIKLDSFSGKSLLNLNKAFVDQKMVSIEMFLHLIHNIQKQSKIKAAANTIMPAGMTQVLPRCLIMGHDMEKYYEILEFSQFLASSEGQKLIAQQGFGIPYYDGRQGTELFCSVFQFELADIQKELSCAESFYENIFLKSGFQERIINPTLMEYFNDGLTFKQAVESIQFRTEQLYSLFYREAAKKKSGVKTNLLNDKQQLTHFF